jgi:hypothetical protein
MRPFGQTALAADLKLFAADNETHQGKSNGV